MSLSVHPSVHPSIHLPIHPSIYLSGIPKKVNFNVGIKIRVSTWSHLSVICPLQIPIPMCAKKMWNQYKNSQNVFFLFVCITYVHYTRGAWDGGGTFLRQRKKVPPAHAQQVWLPSPPRNDVSVRLFVCPSIQNTQKCRFLTQVLKCVYPCGIICPLPVLSKYLFLRKGRKFGFNKKIHSKVLIVFMYYQPKFVPAEHEREEPFKDMGKKFLKPMHSDCFFLQPLVYLLDRKPKLRKCSL